MQGAAPGRPVARALNPRGSEGAVEPWYLVLVLPERWSLKRTWDFCETSTVFSTRKKSDKEYFAIIRGSSGKRRVTQSIPDRRTLLVDSLLFRPHKPGWLQRTSTLTPLLLLCTVQVVRDVVWSQANALLQLLQLYALPGKAHLADGSREKFTPSFEPAWLTCCCCYCLEHFTCVYFL